jgi:ribosomal protein S27E
MIFSAVVSRLLHQSTRACPKCGGQQKVAASKKLQTVDCKSCGASIPPSGGSDSSQH